MILTGILVSIVIVNSVVLYTLSVSNVKLWIELKAMKSSTHQIVMPSAMAENVFETKTEDAEKVVRDAFSEYRGIN